MRKIKNNERKVNKRGRKSRFGAEKGVKKSLIAVKKREKAVKKCAFSARKS